MRRFALCIVVCGDVVLIVLFALLFVLGVCCYVLCCVVLRCSCFVVGVAFEWCCPAFVPCRLPLCCVRLLFSLICWCCLLYLMYALVVFVCWLLCCADLLCCAFPVFCVTVLACCFVLCVCEFVFAFARVMH